MLEKTGSFLDHSFGSSTELMVDWHQAVVCCHLQKDKSQGMGNGGKSVGAPNFFDDYQSKHFFTVAFHMYAICYVHMLIAFGHHSLQFSLLKSLMDFPVLSLVGMCPNWAAPYSMAQLKIMN